MLVLTVLVVCLIWMSLIQGTAGTSGAHYTLDNYSELVLDSAFA
jgi:hypothetical protein